MQNNKGRSGTGAEILLNICNIQIIQISIYTYIRIGICITTLERYYKFICVIILLYV